MENRIKNLSLDQKAKLYYMALLQKGMIDTLPEDPKAAYVQSMIDEPASSKFSEPMGETRDEEDEENDRNLALDDIPDSLRELSTELGYLNEEENYQNLPKPDKINLSYTDPGFRFYGMYLYKDGKRFAKISYEDRATKYLKNLGVNTEIPRSFDTDILDKIKQEIEALGIKGDYDAAMDVS